MVRGSVDGGYNLAIGEPVLIQKYLPFPGFKFKGALPYPTLEGIPELVSELLDLYPGYEVVVTNGGKQALLAAFYAMRIYKPGMSIAHLQPYWPSYPTLGHIGAGGFVDPNNTITNHPISDHHITCVTSPNNPDGWIHTQPCDIWDAVYAHWIYGWKGEEPPHKIRIGSAAKLLGLSGVRVGWLLTKDKHLAEMARHYIEFTTSGVNLLSQHYVANALKLMRQKNPMLELEKIRSGILKNADEFNHLIKPMCHWVDGVPRNEQGMFAWFCVEEEHRFMCALGTAKVALVTGKACGCTVPGTFRMNMAQDEDYTLAALRAIAVAYDQEEP